MGHVLLRQHKKIRVICHDDPPLLQGIGQVHVIRRTTETGLYRRRDVDATLLLARNGLGDEWHLAYHEFMQLYLQARVIYIDAYDMPQFVVIENDTL